MWGTLPITPTISEGFADSVNANKYLNAKQKRKLLAFRETQNLQNLGQVDWGKTHADLYAVTITLVILLVNFVSWDYAPIQLFSLERLRIGKMGAHSLLYARSLDSFQDDPRNRAGQGRRPVIGAFFFSNLVPWISPPPLYLPLPWRVIAISIFIFLLN